MTDARRVLVVGDFAPNPNALEASYARAFEMLGCTVERFDMTAALRRYARPGRVGLWLSQVFPVEAWIRRSNRELAVMGSRLRPTLVVVVCSARVHPGALAQIKSAAGSRAVLIWPDPLLSLEQHTLACLPLYDLVASYSSAAQEPFRRLGACAVAWIPLAADPDLHPEGAPTAQEQSAYTCDVSFVGNWRPEREQALTLLCEALPGVQLKLWGGPDWARFAGRSALVRRCWQRRSAHTRDYTMIVRLSRVSLNIIDPTNYPAANMRFFEILAAGGLQVASACPEMEPYFRQGEHVFYYRDVQDLPGLVDGLLANPAGHASIAACARAQVLAQHTYAHRARQILDVLDGANGDRKT